MTSPVPATPVEIVPYAPNYAALCIQFMKTADGLDAVMLAQHAVVKRAGVKPGSEVGNMMGQAAAAHVGYLFKSFGIATAQFGMVAAAVAARSTKIFPRSFPEGILDRVDGLMEVHANARAHVLLHHFPVAEIAKLMPPALITDEAARYMHGRKRYQLTHVIEGGLMTRQIP